jgi:hypothetical protein
LLRILARSTNAAVAAIAKNTTGTEKRLRMDCQNGVATKSRLHQARHRSNVRAATPSRSLTHLPPT